jgi:mannose-1-phosphate guanylyltransferase
MGVQPTFPSTAYGYIQFDEKSEEDHIDGYGVVTFAEKPHQDLAKRFIESGDFLWNAGIFIWQVSTLFSGIEKHMPDLNEHIENIRERLNKKESFHDIWKQISPESIDYGLLEKTKNIFVIKAKFDWNDLGSWNAVYDYFMKAKDENIIRGKGYVQSGQQNLILSPDKFTAMIGVDNLVVINTDDATLVVSKDEVEKVKDLVSWLKKNKYKDLV